MTTGLERVAQKARSDKTTRLTSLAHHLTKERLLKNLRSIQTSSGVGVDGESKEEALKTFESWSADILSQVHKRAYRPPPVRRVLIPKPGKVDKRPIGVPTIRERVLQKSTAQILESIYETDFLPTSFGGRPKKSAHSALGFLSDKIANGKVSWVYEADLKNFFGSLNHGWMKKFVELRVGDPRILTLIQRWLKAGVMVEGRYEESSEGTPQGGSISVVLSNVYLHYVLDIWFERVVKPRMKGEAYLCRYLDDFIVCFQFKADANRFSRVLRPRLGKFGLSLEPTKTRLVPFGKFVERDSKEHGYRKPPTLKFLGFTLYGMRYPWGYWAMAFVYHCNYLILLFFATALNAKIPRQRIYLDFVCGETSMDAVSIVNLCESALSSSNAVVQKYQKLCFKRRRSLDCFSMVLLIFRLVLSKNSQGYGTTIMEFWDAAKSLVPRLRVIKPVSSSTFCDARDKLDESIFQELNTNLISDYSSALDESYNWKGHRLFCIDGTKVNLPRELIDVGYSLPNSTSHYPIGLVSCLYQLKTKLPFHFELASHLNERKCASNHLEQLNQGDVVIYDRGYLSYALLEIHNRKGIHAVFRLQHINTFSVIEEFAKSNSRDLIVEIEPTKKSVERIKSRHPGIEIRPIKLRLIKYKIYGSEYYLGTTLIDKTRYKKSIFPDLYHSRWGIEELYKVSKKVLDVEDFHGRSERKVKQEIYASFLLITVGRLFSNSAESHLNDSDTKSEACKKNISQSK